jgi:hypothetical protein
VFNGSKYEKYENCYWWKKCWIIQPNFERLIEWKRIDIELFKRVIIGEVTLITCSR